MTIEGDGPPRLGGDVVTFEDMRERLVALSGYEQQIHVTTKMEKTGYSRGGEIW